MPSFTLLLTLALPLLILTPATVAKDLPTDLTGFPPCAQTCISTNHGSCALLDMPCMCTNQVPTIFSCMQGSCDASDQATTLEFAQELCEKANATAATATTGISSSGSARTTFSTATSAATGTATTESTPASGSGSASGSSSGSEPQTDPSPSPSPSPSTTPKPLSTAATAGIGIGTTACALALAGCAFLLWRRRRRRAQVYAFGEASEVSGKAGGKAGGMHGPVVRLDDVEGDAATPVGEGKGMMQVRHEVEGVGVQWMELEAKEVVGYVRTVR